MKARVTPKDLPGTNILQSSRLLKKNKGCFEVSVPPGAKWDNLSRKWRLKLFNEHLWAYDLDVNIYVFMVIIVLSRGTIVTTIRRHHEQLFYMLRNKTDGEKPGFHYCFRPHIEIMTFSETSTGTAWHIRNGSNMYSVLYKADMQRSQIRTACLSILT